jgi:hypothetical protein
MAKTYTVKDTIWESIDSIDDIDHADVAVNHVCSRAETGFTVLFSLLVSNTQIDCSLEVEFVELLKKGPYHGNDLRSIMGEFIKLDIDRLKNAVQSTYPMHVNTTPGRVLHRLLAKLTKPEYHISYDTATEVGNRLAYVYRWHESGVSIRTSQIAADKLDLSSAQTMLTSFLLTVLLKYNPERLNLRIEPLCKVLVLGETLADFATPDPEIEISHYEKIDASRVFEGSIWLEQFVGRLTNHARAARSRAIEAGLLDRIGLYIKLVSINGYLESPDDTRQMGQGP